MTATLTRDHVTDVDELVRTAIERLDEAVKHLDLPLTVARLHVLRQDLTVVRGHLGTIQHLRAKGRA